MGCSFNSERHPARELKGALSRVGTELFLTLKKKAATAVNTGGGVFPLPMVPCDTPRDDHATDKGHWLNCLIASLNWMSGGVLGVPPRGEMNALQKDLVGTLEESMVLIDRFSQENFTDESMRAFWSRRIVNAYGEECHSAQKIRWANLIHSLPPKGLAGIVRGEESCTGGVRDFLINPAKYLKPVREWVYMPPPRIFVDEDDWPEVAAGLIDRGICEPFPLKDVIRVDGKPMVGGLFGVPKNENVDGVDVLRLIMDLRPVNSMFQSIVGDMSTLPMLSQLQPLELYPNETLLISSEDIKAMFYVVSLGSVWRPLLCFGRVLPPELSPDPHEEYVLSSLVLPMGFINSVAVAQALHRGIVHAAMDKHKVSRSFEIRRDQPLPQESLGYRIYLDNFDLLRRTNPEAASLLDGTLDPLAGALREEYSRHKVPRNLKKSAESQLVAEVQGVVVDGVQGIIYPKLEKVGRYFKAAYHLLKSERCDLKRMQVTLGGFNYLFSFRRPLMSIFNESWTFMASFEGNMRLWQPIPNEVKEELFAALSLSLLAFMDIRMPYDPLCTVSDASEDGGGLCQSVGLTAFGQAAKSKFIRGEREEVTDDNQLLVISLFDGMGSLRVALDTIGAQISGYVSVERSSEAYRTLQSNFPGVQHFDDVVDITPAVVQSLAGMYPRTSCVLVAGGPPSEAFSGSCNCDPVAALHSHVCRVRDLCKDVFSWCETLVLMTSGCSIDEKGRVEITRAIGMLPFKIDALGLSLCRRPRFWWFDWIVEAEDGVEIYLPPNSEARSWGQVSFNLEVNPDDYLPYGWSLAGGTNHKLCTFTTSQPKKGPGFKPAGVQSCSERDLSLWAGDRWRFPPHHYKYENGLVHKRKGWKMVGVSERECILGLPLDYTLKCLPKQAVKTDPLKHEDTRLTLLGNSWGIQVAAFLMRSLCLPRNLCPQMSLQTMLQRCQPGSGQADAGLNSFLTRPPWKAGRNPAVEGNSEILISRLGTLVSTKGSDILLKAETEPVVTYDKLRTTVPAHLWSWKTVCGWRWKYGQSPEQQEHINKLELRAVLTSIRWRIFKQRIKKTRFLHLVDSLVSLHILNKGRSSSRSLQRIIKKINALLLLSHTLVLLGYVDTASNPADAPSRRGMKKRKWASVVL